MLRFNSLKKRISSFSFSFLTTFNQASLGKADLQTACLQVWGTDARRLIKLTSSEKINDVENNYY